MSAWSGRTKSFTLSSWRWRARRPTWPEVRVMSGCDDHNRARRYPGKKSCFLFQIWRSTSPNWTMILLCWSLWTSSICKRCTAWRRTAKKRPGSSVNCVENIWTVGCRRWVSRALGCAVCAEDASEFCNCNPNLTFHLTGFTLVRGNKWKHNWLRRHHDWIKSI